ncbi:hypothetical protein DFH06DRAFT_1136155 [Mycena polygramma]|nr:hypothetical protein DFH06DRAFT_1136155 [Mycena polygramma]
MYLARANGLAVHTGSTSPKSLNKNGLSASNRTKKITENSGLLLFFLILAEKVHYTLLLLLVILVAGAISSEARLGVGEKDLVPLTEDSQDRGFALVEAGLQIFDVIFKIGLPIDAGTSRQKQPSASMTNQHTYQDAGGSDRANGAVVEIPKVRHCFTGGWRGFPGLLQGRDCFRPKRNCRERLRPRESLETWTEETDILRCNPNFHHNPRYDHVLVNDTPDDLSVARLAGLLRCKLPDDSVHDIAFVHKLIERSKWVPKTQWANMRVYDEQKSFDFVMVKYLIRGAHMIPVFDANKPSLTFLNDVIDGDMFLRAGN